ncbi:MAG: hypothetical protein JO225_00070 [Candidatus Eremiobacteraeota bacterium]|nr:hypothetical protein [Candidatus Eremiobacteraeota bacterium]MBV8642294.1 hypothetical protein [Candidatus Eremiobacteraeota bacterium]
MPDKLGRTIEPAEVGTGSVVEADAGVGVGVGVGAFVPVEITGAVVPPPLHAARTAARPIAAAAATKKGAGRERILSSPEEQIKAGCSPGRTVQELLVMPL